MLERGPCLDSLEEAGDLADGIRTGRIPWVCGQCAAGTQRRDHSSAVPRAGLKRDPAPALYETHRALTKPEKITKPAKIYYTSKSLLNWEIFTKPTKIY